MSFVKCQVKIGDRDGKITGDKVRRTCEVRRTYPYPGTTPRGILLPVHVHMKRSYIL